MEVYAHIKEMYTNIHSSFICDNLKLQTSQMFINWWADSQLVEFLYNGKIIRNELLI